MKQIVRAFLFLLLFAAASNTTMADEKANIVKQGTVRGRIIDVTSKLSRVLQSTSRNYTQA